MRLHGLRERYDAIMVLRKEGHSNETIGERVGLSRAATQRMVWLSQLPKPIRESYLAGGFPDGKIFGLWQLRGDPKALNAAFKALGPYKRRKIVRTESRDPPGLEQRPRTRTRSAR